MTTMRAWRCAAWSSAPELVELPVPEPGPGEVLLAVTAVGLCHSDLHVTGAAPGVLPYELPFTLGHEVAGTVHAVGAGVDPGMVGRAVVVHGIWGCGACRRCRQGLENYCLRRGGAVGGGLGRDGGLADFMLVPDVRHLVDATGVDPCVAAPLTDGGLTSLHAIGGARVPLDGSDSTAVVIGVGGLGHLAIQLLRHLTPARVVASDTRSAALDLAVRCGAGAAVPPDRLAAEVGEADLVLDFVGSPATVALGASLVTAGGELSIVGSAGGDLEVAKGRALAQGFRVSLPFWGSRAELQRLMELAREGHVVPETTRISLAEVAEAYAALHDGSVVGRFVVDLSRG
ncbi:NAD(P)-dependent alcohol dehydrogenase [Nocardioides zeae]